MRCKHCNACRQVLRKIRYNFWESKLYYCTVSKSITEKENNCEKWQPIKFVCDLSSQRFDKAENDLKYLISVLNKE